MRTDGGINTIRHMSRSASLFSRLWRWLAYSCGAIMLLLVLLVVSMTLKQERENRSFIHSELVPLASFVESFRDSHGHLPSDTEFREWADKAYAGKEAVLYYSIKPKFMSDWGTPGRDFIVGAWRGEWFDFYRSWDKKDLRNP